MTSLRLRMFLMVFVVVAAAVGTVSVLARQGTFTAVNELVFFNAARDQRLATQLLSGADGSFEVVAGGGTFATNFSGGQARVEALGAVMDTPIFVVNQSGYVVYDSSNTLTGQAVRVPPGWPGPELQPVLVANQPGYVVLGLAGAAGSTLIAENGPYLTSELTDTVMFFGPLGVAAATLAAYPGSALAGPPPGPWTAGMDAGMAPTFQAQAVLGTFNQTLLLAAVAGGGVALVLTAGLSRGIVGPVEDLTRAVRRMAQGDRRQRVTVRSRDEIGELARAFNLMADSVGEAEQLRRQMVSDIAHELRTPLTNIRGYLEAVRDGVITAEPSVIDSLHEEAMLLNRLVADLQELALAEAGQLKLAQQPVAVADVVEKTVNTLRPLFAAGPAVRVDLPADLPLVTADPERLGQVLRNLLTNAQHHTPAAGEIVVAAQVAGATVEITVRDSGCGIAAEHLPYVFERFYRADQARARATGGAGLGLAIVKQLVEAHGGQVRVESRPGGGATFAFTLPLAAT